MDLYKIRLDEIPENDKRILIKKNIVEMSSEVKEKSKHTLLKSRIFGWVNTGLNLTIVLSSAVITILTSIYDTENIPAIVLGGLIFAISGTNEILKLGDRGFFYRQGTLRLRRIQQQLSDIMHLFQNFSSDEMLAFLNSFRTEVDEIDLDLYRSSVSGNAKFGNELSIQASEIARGSTPTLNQPETESPSHVYIHIDNLDREEKGKEEENKTHHRRKSSSPKTYSLAAPKIEEETPEDPPPLLELEAFPPKKKKSSSRFFEREDIVDL